MARDAWTDERLDDLKGSVDAGFAENREEFRALRAEIRTGRAETREELEAGRAETRKELEAGRAETRQELKGSRSEMRDELNASRAETREELKAWRGEMREEIRTDRVGTAEKFDRVHSDMREIRAELGSLNRTLHQFLFAIVGTIFLGFMGTISALITLT